MFRPSEEGGMDRSCSEHGQTKIAYKILVEKVWKKRTLERFWWSWEENIKMIWEVANLDSSGSAQRRMASCCEFGVL